MEWDEMRRGLCNEVDSEEGSVSKVESVQHWCSQKRLDYCLSFYLRNDEGRSLILVFNLPIFQAAGCCLRCGVHADREVIHDDRDPCPTSNTRPSPRPHFSKCEVPCI